MAITFRRIVTGLDADGHSTIVADDRVGEAVPGNIDLWRSLAGSISDGATDAPFGFFPTAGETILRVVSLPPAPAGASRDDMEAAARTFFAALGAESCRVDTRRDPWMHRTPTLDYVMVLSGDVSLLVDTGDPVPVRRHELVVQRGTNHNWVNTGPEPATLLVVMVGEPRREV